MGKCVESLKSRTGRSTITICDSTVDEFTDQCLFDKAKGKNVAVVCFTTAGDVFGVLQRCRDGAAETVQGPDDVRLLVRPAGGG